MNRPVIDLEQTPEGEIVDALDPMVPLRNRRRERLCQLLVNGPDWASAHCVPRPMSAAEAARKAGYSVRSARQIAFDILTKTDVKARIRYLQDENAAKFGVSRASLTAEFEISRRLAVELGQAAAAAACTKGKAAVNGFWRPGASEDELRDEDPDQMREEKLVMKLWDHVNKLLDDGDEMALLKWFREIRKHRLELRHQPLNFPGVQVG